MNYAEAIAYFDSVKRLMEAIQVAGLPEPQVTISVSQICMYWGGNNGGHLECTIVNGMVHVCNTHKNCCFNYYLNDHDEIIAKLKGYL